MSFLELLAWTVWENTRPRKIITLLLIGAAAPSFALLLRLIGSHFDGANVYSVVVPLAVYSFTLVLLCTIFASGIISSEMTGRTIQFLLTRPVPRWKIFTAKWAGATIIVAVTVMLSCALTAVVTQGGEGLATPALRRDLLILPLGAATYCGVFSLLSVLSTKPWLFAVFFSFAWESWVPSMPGDFSKLSIMSYLRTLSGHRDATQFGGVLEAGVITQSQAWNTVIVLAILCLAIATILFSNSEFVPKEESI